MSKESPNEFKIINKNERLKYRQTINELKQQLAEKDKEIEELKLKLDIRAMNLQNINTERMEAVRNQTQLAIQELEKVKAKVRDVSGALALCEVEVQIDQQIKLLKGEKDVKD